MASDVGIEDVDALVDLSVAHPHLATTLDNIAACYQEMEDSEQAVAYLVKSSEMWRKVHATKPHPNVATSLNNLGKCCNYCYNINTIY